VILLLSGMKERCLN